MILQKQEGQYARIHGRNFEGQIELFDNLLKLHVTQFQKGGIYSTQLTNDILLKDFRKYIIFSDIQDLFNQLISNQNLQISDQQSILLPINVIYKEKQFKLKAEVVLKSTQHKDQSEKLEALYAHIAKMNKFYSNLQKEGGLKIQNNPRLQQSKDYQSKDTLISQLIQFKPDETNERIKSFQIIGNQIKNLANQYAIINHFQQLPKKGRYHFKLKTIGISSSRFIIVGLCGKNIKNQVGDNILKSPYFMGYSFNGNGVYYNRSDIPGVSPITFTENTIVKLDVNLNENIVTWSVNDQPLYLARIPKQLFDVYIYPCVVMYTAGDRIEFINN